MPELPVTEQSISGLMSAIEALQEILFQSGLTSPAALAKTYDDQAQRYFDAGLAEAAHVLDFLGTRLEDHDRSQKRLLIHSKPQGRA